MIKSALILLSGNAAGSAMFLIRSLIIARLISVEDFGIAATFAMAMAVIEMLSAIGLQQQMVQARDGEDPKLQTALQGFHFLRGVISAVLLFGIAGPIALFMAVPDLSWTYRALAIMPLIYALTHYDVFRLSRELRFGPMVAVNVLPPLLSLLSVYPLFLLFGDFRVMLGAMLVQALTYTGTSHFMAQRRYGLRFDLQVMQRSIRFGWPLLFNGILLFLVFQGDKAIVGRELGLEALALLSIGFTLTLAPTLLVARSSQNFFLPQLSKIQDEPEAFDLLASAVIQAVLAMALLLMVVITVVGGPIVLLLLKPEYAPLTTLLIWLGMMQTIRVFKAGPAIVAMAQAHTGNAMISNLVRVITLPLAWYAAVNGADLTVIVWIGIGGELVGGTIALGLVYRRQPVAPRRMVWPIVGAMAMATISAIYALGLTAETGAYIAPLWVWAGLAASGAFTLWTMRELRSYDWRRQATPDTEKTPVPQETSDNDV